MRIHVNAKSVERRRATTLALSVVAVATIATSSGSMIGPPPLGRVSHNETIITTTPIWESSSEQQLQRRLRRGLLRSSTRDDESSLLSVSASDVETQVVLLSPRQGPRRLVTTGDNLKVLVVLCRFTDHVDDRVLPTREYFDQLFNGGGEGDGSGSSDPSVVNPVGSVREWLESNSNGRYKGKTIRNY